MTQRPDEPLAPRVVVAGAGFAGVRVCKELEDDLDVTLVAPTDEFVYVPLVHEVVSENVPPTAVTRRLDEVLPSTRLVHDHVEAIEKHHVLTHGDAVPFDVCVVAVGSEAHDFGVPGVHDHALTFQDLPDALRAKAAIQRAVAREGRASIVIVGAGYTGVELAGEVHELGERLGASLEITLLDALPQIFPRQTEEFRERVIEALHQRGIELRTGVRIVEVTEGAVIAQRTGPVEADVVFWCAGVRPRALRGVDPRVRPTLQSVARDDVFVVGDAASFPPEMDVPRLAQTAEDQARVCAWNILYPDAMQTYGPDVRGLIVSIGHHHAVAQLRGGRVVAGNLPWHVKRLFYKAKIALT